MQWASILTVILSIVMVSGLVLINFSTTDSFAEKGGNEKSQGTPSSCEKDKGKAAYKNPNCDSTTEPPIPTCNPDDDPLADCDGDGLLNGEDFCPVNAMASGHEQTEEDWDGDGLPNHTESDEKICVPA